MRTKGGKLVDKGYLYRILNNRVYIGLSRPKFSAGLRARIGAQ